MKKVDWMIAENNRILDEMQHRTEVENEAFELMTQGKFDEARELVESLDDSLLEFREWPGEEESETQETNVRDIRHTAKEAEQAIMALARAGITAEKIEDGVQEEHYESFFVCPNCKVPIVRKSAMKYLKNENYCGKCGFKIATAIKEAMAKR